MAEAAVDVAGAAAEVLVPEPVLGPEPELVTGAAAEVTGAVAEAAVDVAGAAAEVLVPELVTGAAAEVTGAGAEVLVPELVLGPVPEPVLGPEPELVTEVTGAVAEAAVDVAGAAAEVLVPELVTGAAAEVTGAGAEVLVPELVLGPEPELVLGPVAAEVTVPAAEVTVPEPTGGVVAACACRENASKTARIPAATIATCTARRAMCRKIGCGMSSSRTNGTDQTRLVLPIISDPKHAGALYFRPISLWSPATGHL